MLPNRLELLWRRFKDWLNGLGWDTSQKDDELDLLGPDPEAGGDEINPGTGYPMLDDIMDIEGNTYGRGDDALCDDD